MDDPAWHEALARAGKATAAYRRLQQARVPPDAADAWEAFCRLSSARPEAGRPIPIGELLAWCQLHRIEDLDARERLTRLITALDRTLLKHHRDKPAVTTHDG